jgi:hypothetical protein
VGSFRSARARATWRAPRFAASADVGGKATAFVDPYIFVDPHFANASDYTITVLDGVANAPPVDAVPEPNAATLLLAGLGLIGVVTARRPRA